MRALRKSCGAAEAHYDVRLRGCGGIQFRIDAVLAKTFGAVVVGVLQENPQAFHFRVIGLLQRFVDGTFQQIISQNAAASGLPSMR